MQVVRKIVLFLLLAAALDQTLGALLGVLYERALTGEVAGVLNNALRQDAELLVIGSSRARHHVDPDVLGARLHLHGYNAGANGQDFLYSLMFLDLWRPRHPAPKLIVMTLDPTTLLHREDEVQGTNVASYYRDQSQIVREFQDLRGPLERWKQLSALYRLNGKILPVLKNALLEDQPIGNGFVGLPGQLQSAPVTPTDLQKERAEAVEPPWDLKMRYLNQLILHCRAEGTRLVLVHPPRLQPDLSSAELWHAHIQKLLSPWPEVRFLDYTTPPLQRSLVSDPALFADPAHLNRAGAQIFSQLLADDLTRTMAQ